MHLVTMHDQSTYLPAMYNAIDQNTYQLVQCERADSKKVGCGKRVLTRWPQWLAVTSSLPKEEKKVTYIY